MCSSQLKIFRTIVLFSVVFTFLCVSAQEDWDWMDCHDHGYYTDQTVNDMCVCDELWTGIDCSLCLNNTSCGPNMICDHTLLIEDYKAFNCTPTQTDLIPAGGITAQWDFTDSSNATGVVSVFIHPTGAPFLFNCTFWSCSKDIDPEEHSETVTCEHTSCHCSSWCNLIVSNIINNMKTTAYFTCDTNSGICSIKQNELPLVIDIQCQAASCQSSPYHPKPHPFTPMVVGLISGGAVFMIWPLVGALIFIYTLIRTYRRSKQMVEYHPLNENIELTLTYQDISCTIGSRTVLNGITGVAEPGKIMAILGPSGAGKTTFLDMLAGRKNVGKFSGSILINGQPPNKSYKRLSGYVYQDDRIMGTLTVREHLMYVAELRLPSYISYDQKIARVEEVMEELNISHIGNSRIGTQTIRGISGGERRRLNIASELITDPPILFLDEPTSGLDSYTAYSLMESLKKLATTKKRTIVVSIHQPRSNIYQLFDNLLLLSCGELVYFGSTTDVLQHFASVGYECPRNFNPADYLIDVVTMNSEGIIKSLAQRYRESHLSHNVVSTLHSIQAKEDAVEVRKDFMEEYASTFLTQIWVLCKRTFTNNLRNPYLIRTQYFLTICLALFVGIIFFKVTDDLAGVQNRAGCMFFALCLLSFGSMTSIDTFFEERPLFLRERANGMYRTSAYFIAKTICDVLPMRIIPPLLLGGIIYYMVGFQSAPAKFFWFLLTLTLVSLVAGSLCLAISSCIPSLGLGNLIAILVLLFSMLFGGFLLNKTSMPKAIEWIKWTSPIQYGFEILMVNELNNMQVLFNPTGVDHDLWKWVNGRVFLQQFDMEPGRVTLDFFVLGGMAAIYLLASYVLLRFATKERR